MWQGRLRQCWLYVQRISSHDCKSTIPLVVAFNYVIATFVVRVNDYLFAFVCDTHSSFWTTGKMRVLCSDPNLPSKWKCCLEPFPPPSRIWSLLSAVVSLYLVEAHQSFRVTVYHHRILCLQTLGSYLQCVISLLKDATRLYYN